MKTRGILVVGTALAAIGAIAGVILQALVAVWNVPVPGAIAALGFLVVVVLTIAVTAIHYKVMFQERDWLFGGIAPLLFKAPSWLICVWLLAVCNVFWTEWMGIEGVGVATFLIVGCTTCGLLLFVLLRRPELAFGTLCPNGHTVYEFNRFCPQCGVVLPRSGGA